MPPGSKVTLSLSVDDEFPDQAAFRKLLRASIRMLHYLGADEDLIQRVCRHDMESLQAPEAQAGSSQSQSQSDRGVMFGYFHGARQRLPPNEQKALADAITLHSNSDIFVVSPFDNGDDTYSRVVTVDSSELPTNFQFTSNFQFTMPSHGEWFDAFCRLCLNCRSPAGSTGQALIGWGTATSEADGVPSQTPDDVVPEVTDEDLDAWGV